jgi:hypothetical protein
MKTIKYSVIGIILWLTFSCNQNNSTDENQIFSDKVDTSLFSSFNDTLFREVQLFEINTSKENYIEGKQGTHVTIPKDCFGKLKGNVTIEMIECYSIQDMLFNKLTTVTEKGEILVSDGMFYLNAISDNGDTLKVVDKKSIKVQMPTKKIDKEMKIFQGYNSDNFVSWKLLDNKIHFSSKDEGVDTIDVIEEIAFDSTTLGVIKYGEAKITYGETKGAEVVDKIRANWILNDYLFSVTKLGWTNCDKFLREGSKNLTINVGKDVSRTQFYAVYNGAVSIIPFSIVDSLTIQFKNIPKATSCMIIGLGFKNDIIFFNFKEIAADITTTNFPILNEITREELKEFFVEKFGKDIWSRPSI